MSFDKLQEKIDKLQNPTVVGLDISLDTIPPLLLTKHFKEKGETLEAAAEAVLEYNIGLIESLYDIVPAVKPQSAFYEALGPVGVGALKVTIDYARKKGMYVILDGKRNDIGSTAEAYSAAYLGAVKIGKTKIFPFNADALTINPYLGSDGVIPFLKDAKKFDKAVFVLVKTSNPSAGELQDKYYMIDNRRLSCVERRKFIDNDKAGAGEEDRRKTKKDRRDNPYNEPHETLVTKKLYTIIGECMEEISHDTIGKYGFTRLGAVVGATYPEDLRFLRNHLKHTFFLVPGYGAQGGSAESISAAFDKNGRGAIINSSRGIIAAWKNLDNEKTTGEKATIEKATVSAAVEKIDLNAACAAARTEAIKMREELRAIIEAKSF